ncbi:hypothetical protein AB2C69_32195, partial [Pseudomonas aeruginosa]
MTLKLITIREYARLTTEAVMPSLDEAQISNSAFDWLCVSERASHLAGGYPVVRQQLGQGAGL